MSGYISAYQTIFIHVPKTAGTSIERLPWIRSSGHDPIWTFSKDLRDTSFKCAFTREPHHRFMSAATAGFLVDGNPPFAKQSDIPPFAVMRDKITDIIKGIYDDNQGRELQPEYIFQRNGRGHPDPMPHFVGWSYRVHYFPQWFFLTDKNGDIGVDLLGRYETLESSWKRICSRMGAIYQPLPHLRNAQIHRPSLEYFYTPETWDMITTLYQTDFDLFNYAIYGLEELNEIT